MSKKKADEIRSLVLDVMLEAEKTGQYESDLVKAVLKKYDYLEARDKAFLKRLAEGCTERRISLDYLLDRYLAARPMAKQKPLIRAALRMGAYQILYMDSVPAHSACNETVKLLEDRHFGQLKGFVNGVLRHLSKDFEEGTLPLPAKEEVPVDLPEGRSYTAEKLRKLSVLTSLPVIVLSELQKDYGPVKCRSLAFEQLGSRPVHVRVAVPREGADEQKEPRKITEDLKSKWTAAGLSFHPHEVVENCYVFTELDGVERLPGFSEGLCSVQNASSMLVGLAADIHEDDLVMDVCAAPGGKSMHAASFGAKVLAFDQSEDKVTRMEENFRRMGLEDQISAAVADATVTDETRIQKADVLLMDVPCSGFGIFGRKNDIKYHVTPEGLSSLEELQKRIVTTCIPYCKSGGTIIYSTCTMRKAENENMVEWMLQNFPLEPVSLNDVLPKSLQNEESAKGMCQIFPDEGEYDGFFLAKFRMK